MTVDRRSLYRFVLVTLAVPSCIWFGADVGGELGFTVGVILFAWVLIMWSIVDKLFLERPAPRERPTVLERRPVFTGPTPLHGPAVMSRDSDQVAKIRRIADDPRTKIDERIAALEALKRVIEKGG